MIQPNLKSLSAYMVLAFLGLLSFAQGPANDHCAKAIPIEPGQYIANISNATATRGYPFENPDTVPVTCIPTLENDLWYKFTTREDIQYYEITIASHACNTPAGLQALLIRSDDCNNKHYRYKGCASKQTLDTIKIFLEEPTPGLNYFIYIDGYDGTICEFDLWLNGIEQMGPEDYRYLRNDYKLDEPPYGFPEGFEAGFENNQATMRWTASPEEDIAYFVVERWPDLGEIDEESPYMQVVGMIDPRNRVGSGEMNYEFRDYFTKFQADQVYTYRLVTVDSEGGRSVTNEFDIKAELIKEFFVDEVKATSEKNIFQAYYINRKKKQDFELYVFNEAGEAVKQFKMAKQSALDGTISIDMNAFPSGRYTFKMGNSKGYFVREFYVE